MRPSPSRFALVACVVAAVAAPAAAQFGLRPKVRIENPRVGFRPAGGNERGDGFIPQFVNKSGAWAPVWFNLEVLRETADAMRLEVTASDGDNFRTVTSVPILRKVDTKAGEQPRAKESRVEFSEMLNAAYARLGGETGSVKLQIVSDDDDRTTLSDPVTIDKPFSRSASTYVILSLGSTVPGLGFKRKDQRAQDGPYLRDGRVELAKVESLQEMPDQWFGYDAADLVILGTGKADRQFVADLFGSSSALASRKRWALFEWVRRGGKLVVSVGERAEEVRTSAAFEDVLPAAIGPSSQQSGLRSEQFGVGAFTALDLKYRTKGDQKPDPFPVAALTPKANRGAAVLLSDEAGKRPLVVQAPLGLGRVTAVAFDLDRSPFVDDANRVEFWDWLVEKAGAERAAKPSPRQANANPNTAALPGQNPEDGAAAALRSNVDAFEGVPVISFGWVALFILGYTLVIGPIEYLFLKKVLGRLELTWVTFPLIVLTVSAAAYFTAYAVKGKDLRINKIDVVDVDARDQGRLYGRTWFTVFSPRIDSYTLGVEPKDNWAKRPDTGPVPPTLVDWFGSTGGAAQIGGSSRSYRYQFDLLNDDGRPTGPANCLVNVPIQVWSTKAFTASWSGVPAGPLPPVVADLTHPADGKKNAVFGEITLNLPIRDVQEAFLIYQGKVYELDRGIATGVPVRVNTGKTVDPSQSPLRVDDRFYAAEQADPFGGMGGPRGRPRAQAAPVTQTGPLQLWGLLFHEAASGGGRELQNASLRTLDQSWRLDEKNTDEVIVLIRLKRVSGEAEELLAKPDSASPTALWLKGLPGSGPRPEVLGKLQQDTYLRFFIPVKPAGR
jgi:hypothetical protein